MGGYDVSDLDYDKGDLLKTKSKRAGGALKIGLQNGVEGKEQLGHPRHLQGK